MDECILINESDQLFLVTIPFRFSGMDKRSCDTQGPSALHAGLNFETSVFPSCAKEIFKNGFKNGKIGVANGPLKTSENFRRVSRVSQYRFLAVMCVLQSPFSSESCLAVSIFSRLRKSRSTDLFIYI